MESQLELPSFQDIHIYKKQNKQEKKFRCSYSKELRLGVSKVHRNQEAWSAYVPFTAIILVIVHLSYSHGLLWVTCKVYCGCDANTLTCRPIMRVKDSQIGR